MKKVDYRKKALDIIKSKGISGWINVQKEVHIEAIKNGYCCNVEGLCEEDHCRCRSWLAEQEKLTKLINI